MPQEPFCGLLVNERGKASAFRPSPGMQLDYMMAVIDAFLKRWRVPHFSNRLTMHLGLSNRNSQDLTHSNCVRADRFDDVERHTLYQPDPLAVSRPICLGIQKHPSVAAIKGVQLRIGILKLKRQPIACADAAIRRVTHFGFLIFETIGQHNPRPMYGSPHWSKGLQSGQFSALRRAHSPGLLNSRVYFSKISPAAS